MKITCFHTTCVLHTPPLNLQKKKKKYKKGSSWAIVMDAIFYGFGEEMDCNKDGSWQGFCVEFKF
jgi:hypothetical protein